MIIPFIPIGRQHRLLINFAKLSFSLPGTERMLLLRSRLERPVPRTDRDKRFIIRCKLLIGGPRFSDYQTPGISRLVRAMYTS